MSLGVVFTPPNIEKEESSASANWELRTKERDASFLTTFRPNAPETKGGGSPPSPHKKDKEGYEKKLKGHPDSTNANTTACGLRCSGLLTRKRQSYSKDGRQNGKKKKGRQPCPNTRPGPNQKEGH